MEARIYSLQTRNGGHRKVSVPRSPTGSCWVSVWPRAVTQGGGRGWWGWELWKDLRHIQEVNLCDSVTDLMMV